MSHVDSPMQTNSLLKNVAWTPRSNERQSEMDGRGVHSLVLQQAANAFS